MSLEARQRANVRKQQVCLCVSRVFLPSHPLRHNGSPAIAMHAWAVHTWAAAVLRGLFCFCASCTRAAAVHHAAPVNGAVTHGCDAWL